MKLLATILVFAGMAAGQVSQPRGKEIVYASLQKLGGDKFLAMKDRTEIGRVYSFYREQLSGLAKAIIYTRYLTAPDPPKPGEIYSRERTSYGASVQDRKKEDYAVLFDENSGYQVTYRGARLIAGEILARYKDTLRRNVFYILRFRLKEPGLIIEHLGSEVDDNHPVERVRFTDAENDSVEVLFSRSSLLPVKQVFYRRDPKTRERNEEITRFDKYRESSGVQWPRVIMRERNGERIFQMFSEAVEINTGLTDELFALPGGVKMLPPAR
jgi:hypothetical protein